MTVETTKNKSGPYVLNGVRLRFPRTFKLTDASHLRVIRVVNGVDSDVTTGFTQTGIGENSGEVVFTEATVPPSGALLLLRSVPLTQETDYANQARVQPEQVERDFDKQEMQIQDMQEQLDRAVKVGPSVPNPDDINGPLADALIRLNESADNIDVVAGSIGNVDAVAGRLDDVTTLAENIDIIAGASGSVVNNVDASYLGDGATTVFTLPAYALSDESVFLWVDKVRLTVDKYDVSGTQITLMDAPESGVAVDVRVSSTVSMGDVRAQADRARNEANRARNEADRAALLVGSYEREWPSRADAIANYHPAVAPDKIRVSGYAAPGDGGDAIYVRVSSPPAHGFWFSILTEGGAAVLYALQEDVVCPEMFGGIIGSPDVVLGINRMINYQKVTGAIIDGNGKRFPLNATISLPIDSRVVMRNITFDGTGIVVNGQFTTPVMQQLCPGPSNSRILTVTAGSNAAYVTVDNAAGFAVADWVLLRSNKIMAETEVNGDATRHSRACELLQIASIAGNVITFRSRTEDGYATTDGATLAKVQTAGSVDFSNVTFIGADTGFYTTDSFRSRYRDCTFINMSSRGLFEDRCYLTDGDNWDFQGNAVLPAFTQAAYGLCYMSSQNGTYGRVRGHRMRHLTTTGSNQSSRGRSVSRGNVLGDIYATDCFAAPVDQHPGGGFIQVGNVFATFADNASQQVAVQLQGGGGMIGAVEANAGGVLQFDCCGFFQNNFNPYVFIAAGHSRNSDVAINIMNLTNRWGTGQSQTLRFHVGNADFYTGVGVQIAATNGNVEGGIEAGHVQALSTLGLGRCVYGTVGDAGTYRPLLRFGNVNMRAQSGSRIIDLGGGNMQMNGGILIGVGGTTEVRLNNAILNLIGTTETSLTTNLIGSSAVRRVSLS